MTDPIPDLAKIRKVLDIIDSEPENWNQRWYESVWGVLFPNTKYRAVHEIPGDYCGTTRCFAGWVQYLDKGQVNLNTAYEHARDSLGITEDEAYELFQSNVGLTKEEARQDIQRTCEKIAERAGERL